MEPETKLDEQETDVGLNPAHLICGMTLKSFELDIRELTTRHFAGAFDPIQLGQQFDLPVLESLLATDRVPASHVDVIFGGLPKRLTELQRGVAQSSLALVTGAVRRKATIRISDIQRFHQPLEKFAHAVANFFAARSQINVYLTPPGGSGFEPHFDTTDIFIVQCAGAKDWTLFKDYSSRTELPLLETPWDPDRYSPAAESERLTLQAGDVLYLPRGVMHMARCIDELSLHLTISVSPLTVTDVFVQEIKRLAARNIDLRQRLDWTTDAPPERLQFLNTEMRRRLVELADELDVASLLSSEAHLLRGHPASIAPAGELEAALRQ